MLSQKFIDDLYSSPKIQEIQDKYDESGVPFDSALMQISSKVVTGIIGPKAEVFVEAIARLLLQRLDDHLKKPAKTKAGRFLRCALNFLKTIKWEE